MHRLINIKGIGTITLDNLLISDIPESTEGKYYITFKTKFGYETKIGLDTEELIYSLTDDKWKKSINEDISITNEDERSFHDSLFCLRCTEPYSELWDFTDNLAKNYVYKLMNEVNNNLLKYENSVYYVESSIKALKDFHPNEYKELIQELLTKMWNYYYERD